MPCPRNTGNRWLPVAFTDPTEVTTSSKSGHGFRVMPMTVASSKRKSDVMAAALPPRPDLGRLEHHLNRPLTAAAHRDTHVAGQARRVLLLGLEHVAARAGADADEHLDEFRPADAEEGHARLAGHRPRQERFARARR